MDSPARNKLSWRSWPMMSRLWLSVDRTPSPALTDRSTPWTTSPTRTDSSPRVPICQWPKLHHSSTIPTVVQQITNYNISTNISSPTEEASHTNSTRRQLKQTTKIYNNNWEYSDKSKSMLVKCTVFYKISCKWSLFLRSWFFSE